MLTDFFNPSLLLIQTHYHHSREKGAIAGAIEQTIADGFFKNVEIPTITHKADLEKINKLLINSDEVTLTMWMSLELYSENLNLAAIEETHRKKSVDRIKFFIDDAVMCNADRLGVISGTDPGPDKREKAIENLYKSLCELCETVLKFHSIRIVFEPLDRGAHKNGVIGPTNEFIQLIERIRNSFPNIGLVWDSAHVGLCGDDIFKSLELSKDLIDIIHLSNADLNRSSRIFGDFHMKIGKPGFLTTQKIADLFDKAIEIDLFGKHKPNVAVEVLSSEQEDPWATVLYCKRILLDAWTHIDELGMQ
jgi:sugar phosphate isomerase/epimerase